MAEDNRMKFPASGELWKHYKGGLYRIVAVGKYEPTMEPVAIYKALKDGEIWVRPMPQFMGCLDENGYVPRFELIHEGGD